MKNHISNEWRLTRRDTGLWILVAAYAALLVYGAAVGVSHTRRGQTEVTTARADYDARWATLRQAAGNSERVWADWRSPSLVGGSSGAAVTWMTMDGLGALGVGESSRLPTLSRVSIYAADAEPPLANPLAIAGGLFDLAFVVIWLLPLAIAAATHAVVSGDRQRGTWRLVAATTSAPGTLVVTRMALPGAIVAGLTIGTGAIAVVAAGGIGETTGVARFGLWALGVVIYAAFWAIVSGAVSSRSASTAGALVTVGLAWLGVVWIVPGVIDVTVSAAYPPPNRVAAHLAARDSQRDPEQNLPRHLDAIYARHPEWRPSPETVKAANTPVPGGPVSRDSRRVYAPAQAAAGVAAPYVAAEHARREQVEVLVQRLAVLSPALAMQAVIDHAAGTSAIRFSGFHQHVAAAEDAWHGFFAPRIMQLLDMNRADVDQVPTPAPYTGHPPSGVLIWPALGLLGPLAAACLLFRRARRHLRG